MIAELADLKVTRNIITLRQIVLDKLRDAIISSQLKPGQRLVERELCQALDVSRTSVREALRHLESEGLVQYVGQRGPSVSVLSQQDIKNIYELRAALEGLAGELFCERASDHQINLLQATTDALKKPLTLPAWIKFWHAPKTFISYYLKAVVIANLMLALIVF